MKNLIEKYKNLPIQAKASIWFLVCSFFQKSVSMLTTPIFTRLLTTSEYGQYSVFNSWLGVATIIVSMNLAAGVFTQGLVKFEKERDIFASSMQGLTLVLVFAWTIIYLMTYTFWNQLLGLTTVQMLAMLLMIWTSSAFSFWANYQRVDYKYKTLVVVTIIVSLAKPIIGIIFVLKSTDKVTARILGLALVEIIFYSYFAFIQLHKGKVFISKKYWKYSLFYSLPLIPHYLSQIVLESADRIMISDMCDSSKAGIYSLAYALASIMILFNYALTQTTSPWIYKKIKERKINEIAPIAYMSLIIIAVANLLLILFAPEAVAIFAPKSYYDAIWVIPPIAMSVYFMYAYDLFAKFAFYYEKTTLIMFASITGALVNILLNSIFINIFGYIAAGYTTMICYIFYGLIHYLLMRWVCIHYCDGEKPYKFKNIVAITIPFIILGLLFLFTYNYPVIRYGLIIVILGIIMFNYSKVSQIFVDILSLRKEN